MVESTYLKVVARIVMPASVALLGYFGSSELAKISSALDIIPQLVANQKITDLKIDQLQKDVATQGSNSYSRDEAAKDWKIQDQKDQLLSESIKDHEKRINALENSKVTR